MDTEIIKLAEECGISQLVPTLIRPASIYNCVPNGNEALEKFYHAARAPSLSLLQIARCPHCDGGGVIQLDCENIEQCRWCFERDLITKE